MSSGESFEPSACWYVLCFESGRTTNFTSWGSLTAERAFSSEVKGDEVTTCSYGNHCHGNRRSPADFLFDSVKTRRTKIFLFSILNLPPDRSWNNQLDAWVCTMLLTFRTCVHQLLCGPVATFMCIFGEPQFEHKAARGPKAMSQTWIHCGTKRSSTFIHHCHRRPFLTINP